MENKSFLSSLTLLLAIAICLSSCGPVLYTGVGQNVPLFQKKGEVTVSGGFSEVYGDDEFLNVFSESASGYNAQFAAAIGEHTAVMSSYYRLKDDEDWSGIGDYFELGVGRFKYNEAKRLTSEIFIGTGWGSVKNSCDGSYVKLKYIKPFVQPSVGFSARHFEIAFTPRIALVSYTSKSENLVDNDDYTYKSSFDDFWSEKRNTVVFEPGLTIRAGLKNVKFQLQYTYTTFTFTESDGYSPVYKNFVSAGLNLVFGR